MHPYNQSALGSVFSTSKTKASMPMAYLSRADRLLDAGREVQARAQAPRHLHHRVRLPVAARERPRAQPRAGQARALNESDRLFYADQRVKSIAQFELFDVPDLPTEDVFNTGLRQEDGTAKPSLAAWRLPLVVTRRGANRVEVWGQVRPARGRARAAVQVARSAKGPFKTLRRVRTNRAGYFRFELRRGRASRLSYRLRWRGHTSRVAKAGRTIRYKR